MENQFSQSAWPEEPQDFDREAFTGFSGTGWGDAELKTAPSDLSMPEEKSIYEPLSTYSGNDSPEYGLYDQAFSTRFGGSAEPVSPQGGFHRVPLTLGENGRSVLSPAQIEVLSSSLPPEELESILKGVRSGRLRMEIREAPEPEPELEEIPAVSEEMAFSQDDMPAAEAVASPDIAPASEAVASPDTAPAAEAVTGPDTAPAAEAVISLDTAPAAEAVAGPDTAPAAEAVTGPDIAPAAETAVDQDQPETVIAPPVVPSSEAAVSPDQPEAVPVYSINEAAPGLREAVNPVDAGDQFVAWDFGQAKEAAPAVEKEIRAWQPDELEHIAPAVMSAQAAAESAEPAVSHAETAAPAPAAAVPVQQAAAEPAAFHPEPAAPVPAAAVPVQQAIAGTVPFTTVPTGAADTLSFALGQSAAPVQAPAIPIAAAAPAPAAAVPAQQAIAGTVPFTTVPTAAAETLSSVPGQSAAPEQAPAIPMAAAAPVPAAAVPVQQAIAGTVPFTTIPTGAADTLSFAPGQSAAPEQAPAIPMAAAAPVPAAAVPVQHVAAEPTPIRQLQADISEAIQTEQAGIPEDDIQAEYLTRSYVKPQERPVPVIEEREKAVQPPAPPSLEEIRAVIREALEERELLDESRFAPVRKPVYAEEPAPAEAPAYAKEPAPAEAPAYVKAPAPAEAPAHTGKSAPAGVHAHAGKLAHSKAPAYTAKPAAAESPARAGKPASAEAPAPAREYAAVRGNVSNRESLEAGTSDKNRQNHKSAGADIKKAQPSAALWELPLKPEPVEEKTVSEAVPQKSAKAADGTAPTAADGVSVIPVEKSREPVQKEKPRSKRRFQFAFETPHLNFSVNLGGNKKRRKDD